VTVQYAERQSYPAAIRCGVHFICKMSPMKSASFVLWECLQNLHKSLLSTDNSKKQGRNFE